MLIKEVTANVTKPKTPQQGQREGRLNQVQQEYTEGATSPVTSQKNPSLGQEIIKSHDTTPLKPWPMKP